MSTLRVPILPVSKAVPPLEAGDRLTRDEFERRYRAMPENVKAELIDGVVYMASPVRYESHGKPHVWLTTWMGLYCLDTPGVEAADNTTTRLDLDNEPQPDLLLHVAPSFGGRVTISQDDYVEGAPELVAEIASSSVSIDLHAKLNAYRRNGVQEYLVYRVQDQAVDWFQNLGGEFVRLNPDSQGVLKSALFPGLWLDTLALIEGDKQRLIQTLRLGLADASHAKFVSTLAAKRR